MAVTIPAVVLLARERAASFRRCAVILHQSWEDNTFTNKLDEVHTLVRGFLAHTMQPVGDRELSVVEWAVRWANGMQPRDVRLLREVRTALEATATDCLEAVFLLRDLAKKDLDRYKWNYPWIYEIAATAANEQLRIEMILREQWPVDSEEIEQRKREEMKRGVGVELDDAFARIAGASKEDWLKRLEEHKKKKGSARHMGTN